MRGHFVGPVKVTSPTGRVTGRGAQKRATGPIRTRSHRKSGQTILWSKCFRAQLRQSARRCPQPRPDASSGRGGSSDEANGSARLKRAVVEMFWFGDIEVGVPAGDAFFDVSRVVRHWSDADGLEHDHRSTAPDNAKGRGAKHLILSPERRLHGVAQPEYSPQTQEPKLRGESGAVKTVRGP